MNLDISVRKQCQIAFSREAIIEGVEGNLNCLYLIPVKEAHYFSALIDGSTNFADLPGGSEAL